MRCDGCKHWDEDMGRQDYAGGVGVCRRAHAFWDRSRWQDTDDGDYRRVLLPEAANDMMFCQDGSDYVAVLLTKPEFFCAHHESK